MDMKRFFLYAIVIAALVMAGCGGNGGGTDMTGGGGTPPATCDPGQTGTPPNCVTPPPPTCLEDPDAANCTGPTQADIDAATEAAETKTTAIATEAAQAADADAGLGGTGATTPYTLAIARDRDGTTVTITDTNLAGAMDPQFMQDMDMGGGTTRHTRTLAADAAGNVEEEVVMVTTDIEAPKATAFGEVADQNLHLNPATTDGTDFRSLQITNDGTVEASDNAIDLMNVRGPAAASSGGTQTITYTDDAGTADVNERRFMGTYNGAAGTYVCTGTSACTAMTNDKGVVSAMGGTWTFTPDAGATSDVADADYLHYGFWLKKTTDADGVLTYNEVETFANSSIAASDDVSAVTGTATYSGGATGVYVKNVFASAGTLDTATSGYFRADANLTATFGQVEVDSEGTIAPNMLWTLTGTISDYQLSGGEANNWMTVLDGDITEDSDIASGTAKGGSPLNDGSFSATFHGTVDATTQPSAVVGEFNSSFTDGSVAGGFGARIDQ